MPPTASFPRQQLRPGVWPTSRVRALGRASGKGWSVRRTLVRPTMPHPAADRGSATISIAAGAAAVIALLAAIIGGIAGVTGQQAAAPPSRLVQPDGAVPGSSAGHEPAPPTSAGLLRDSSHAGVRHARLPVGPLAAQDRLRVPDIAAGPHRPSRRTHHRDQLPGDPASLVPRRKAKLSEQ